MLLLPFMHIWYLTSFHVPAGFGEFMLAVAGRVVFEVCVADWVSSADAQGLALYSEIAALQKIFDQVSQGLGFDLTSRRYRYSTK